VTLRFRAPFHSQPVSVRNAKSKKVIGRKFIHVGIFELKQVGEITKILFICSKKINKYYLYKMNGINIKLCSSCKIEFNCGDTMGSSCWCNDFPPLFVPTNY
jgi:hypothetical protein